jgi:translation initiation factor 2B subunit (eIF-2B alpha/beta/delta family)
MTFKEVVDKIKKIKIQGAENIAIAGVKTLSLKNFSYSKIISARPTEPMLRNALKYAKIYGKEQTIDHIRNDRLEIAKLGAKKIRGIVFTHCHSSTVLEILKEAKRQRRKFEVYNTETRPLYQGRKTAKELSKAKIKVTTVVDSAAAAALIKDKLLKNADLMLVGCDAIFNNGDVVNKVGTGMFAEICYYHKIPVYIVTNSWKFTPKPIKIEMRDFREVWKNAPKKVRVQDLAFDITGNEYITAIISELGILKPKDFVRKVKQIYPWISKK